MPDVKVEYDKLSSDVPDEKSAKSIDIHEPSEIVPNQWYGILEARSLKKKPVAITRMGEKLVLYRGTNGEAICMLNRCPHRGMELTHGRVFGNEIECPFHAFRFSPKGLCTLMPCEGKHAAIPATMRTISFTVREAEGIIWLWWGATAEVLGVLELPPIPWPTDLVHVKHNSTGSFVWPIPYDRATENAVDAHHTPSLHGTRRGIRGWKVPNIGRQHLCKLDIETVPGGINAIYRFSDEDRPDETPFKTVLKYREPGMVIVEISIGLYFVTIDTPIDAKTSWRIIRYYNAAMPVPLIGNVLAWLMRNLDQSLIQWAEDYWLVRHQQRPIPGVHGDHYVKSDAVVTRYYAMKKRLLNEAEATRHGLPPIVQRHFVPVPQKNGRMSS